MLIKSKDLNSKVASYLSLLQLLFFASLSITGGLILFIREISVVAIGVIPLIIFSLKRCYNQLGGKKTLAIILVLIFVASNLLVYGAQQRYLFLDEDTITISSHYLVTNEFITAASWAEEEIAYTAKIIGSDLIFSTIGGLGAKGVDRYNENLNEQIYLGESNNLVSQLEQGGYSYIYFELQLLLYKNNFDSSPLAYDALLGLEQTTGLNKVYTTSNINLFYLA